MTPQEFKAWFDGYTENISKTPTQKQWKRIQERVGEIDGVPVTEQIFIDRYWYTYWPNYVTPTIAPLSPYSITTTNGEMIWLSETGTSNSLKGPVTSGYSHVEGYDSLNAMHALGQAEAQ